MSCKKNKSSLSNAIYKLRVLGERNAQTRQARQQLRESIWRERVAIMTDLEAIQKDILLAEIRGMYQYDKGYMDEEGCIDRLDYINVLYTRREALLSKAGEVSGEV